MLDEAVDLLVPQKPQLYELVLRENKLIIMDAWFRSLILYKTIVIRFVVESGT